MSNYVCPECGANYIDCGQNKPSVLAQDLEIARLEAQKKEHCIAIEELRGCLLNCRDYFRSNGLQYFVDKINQTLEQYGS